MHYGAVKRLTVAQLVKNILAVYGTQRIITGINKRSLPRVSYVYVIQSIQSQNTST